jgi:hypothetical protein
MTKSLFFAAAAVMAIAFSNPTQAQLTDPSPYCDASFDDMGGFPVADQIKAVNFGSFKQCVQ